ncbi:MAG TPA: 50S ribosomal protein L22 [Clostridiales bacterium]|nr:50S ribosomal protein L22 [Clostridiales bacterium]
MERKVRTRDELLQNKDSILASCKAQTPKNKKTVLPTKKERKILGIGKDEGRATLKYVRIAPRKVKIVIDLIRGKGLDEAYAILRYTPKASSYILFKMMRSAEANAVNNNNMNRDSLNVSEAFANQGPILKRMMARARGMGARIHKKSSHITLVLREKTQV